MHTPSQEHPAAPAHDDPSEFDERSRDEVHELSDEMFALQEVIAGLKEIGGALDDVDLRPSASRTDWAMHHERIAVMEKRVRAVLLAPLERGISVLDDQDTRANVLDGVAGVIAEYAVLAHVSGAPGVNAPALLAEAVGVATERARPELKEGLQSIDMFARLSAARWDLRHGDRQNADDGARAVVDGAAPPLLTAGAREIVDAPRPLSSAPSLFTFNGFGTGLYGSRDRREDGSVVKTYSLCGLFIPLIPLSAYRVLDHGEGSYSFLHKEKLSGFAKGWLISLPIFFALFLAVGAIGDYLSSSKVAAPKLVTAAKDALSTGSLAGSRFELDTLFQLHGMTASAETLDDAALVYAQALAADVDSPLTLANVPKAKLAVSAFRARVPQSAQLGAGGSFLTTTLEGWSKDLGEKDEASLRAAAELLALAYDVAPGPDARRVEESQLANKLVQASRMAEAWPLVSVPAYVEALPSIAAVEGLARVFDRIPANSSLWIDFAPQAEAWQRAASTRPDLADTKSHVSAGLRAGARLGDDAARAQLLQSGATKKLSKFVQKHPGDQQARYALAAAHLDRGKARAAANVLRGQGGAGMMHPADLPLLARALVGAQDHDAAMPVLTHLIDEKVRPFIATGKAYDARIKAVQEPLLNELRFGALPADLEAKLFGVSDDQQKSILTQWLQAKVEADPQIKRYRIEMMANADAVMVGVLWAELHMDRAEELTSGERVATLSTARAMLDDLAVDGEGNADFMAAAARLSALGG